MTGRERVLAALDGRPAAVVETIRAMGVKVRLHICGSTVKLFADMGKLGADIVDLDLMAALDEARRAIGPSTGGAERHRPGAGVAQ